MLVRISMKIQQSPEQSHESVETGLSRLLSHAITLEVVVSSGRYTSTWALKLEA